MTDTNTLAPTDPRRAEFETWLSPSWSRKGYIDEDKDFIYADDWVQGAWVGWSAARRARVPIANFAAAAAFASEPFTDDTFAAFQQGIRFAERVHGVSNGAE